MSVVVRRIQTIIVLLLLLVGSPLTGHESFHHGASAAMAPITTGVYIPGAAQRTELLDAFEAMVGQRTGIVQWYQPWGADYSHGSAYQPQLDVQFNIQVDRVGDEVHEVALKVEVAARSDQGVHFLIDLSYGGLFALRNIPEDALGPFLLAEAPRLIFPFVRQIIAEASQNMGFPPLLLDPIDFGQAYYAQIEAAQAQAQGVEPNGNGGADAATPEAPADE